MSVERLAYILGKYADDLEADFAHFYPGVDIGDLWRSRRWRKLLNLIDHLPRNTYYAQTVANDEEHMRMLMDAQEAQEDSGQTKNNEQAPPAMSAWTLEAEMLATVIDELRAVKFTLQRANTPKKSSKQPKPPMPYPRPITALHSVKSKTRRQKHEELVVLVLPNKRFDSQEG